MINIENLTQKNKDKVVFNNLNLHIEKNKIFGIIADDGLGKTTLMEILAGIISPTDGSVTLGKYNLATDAEKAKSIIGYVPENMPFYGGMTVVEYLTFVAEAKGLPYEAAQKGVKSALAATELLVARNVLISNLNRVGKVRLGLAQAIVANPQILLLDCPIDNLSESESKGLFKLIKTLSQSKTVVITSKYIKTASLCDKVATISSGQLDIIIEVTGKENV